MQISTSKYTNQCVDEWPPLDALLHTPTATHNYTRMSLIVRKMLFSNQIEPLENVTNGRWLLSIRSSRIRRILCTDCSTTKSFGCSLCVPIDTHYLGDVSGFFIAHEKHDEDVVVEILLFLRTLTISPSFRR